MQNIIDKTNKGALTSIALAINGATLNPTITLLRYPLLVLLALRAAAVTARDNYEVGKALLPAMRDALGVALFQARAFMFLTRDILKAALGKEYSVVWDATGLVGSIEIPQTVDDMIILLETIVVYLTANPALEVPTLNVTAAQAQLLLTALSDARRTTDDQEVTVGNLMQVRDEKFVAVRKGLRGLIDELDAELNPSDLRWKAFGFNMPGANETPDVPTNIIAVLLGATAGLIKWDASPRAQHYRVWMKLHGAPTDYVAMGSPADLDFALENLPASSTIDLAVSAVNDGGESAVSEAVTVTTH